MRACCKKANAADHVTYHNVSSLHRHRKRVPRARAANEGSSRHKGRNRGDNEECEVENSVHVWRLQRFEGCCSKNEPESCRLVDVDGMVKSRMMLSRSRGSKLETRHCVFLF